MPDLAVFVLLGESACFVSSSSFPPIFFFLSTRGPFFIDIPVSSPSWCFGTTSHLPLFPLFTRGRMIFLLQSLFLPTLCLFFYSSTYPQGDVPPCLRWWLPPILSASPLPVFRLLFYTFLLFPPHGPLCFYFSPSHLPKKTSLVYKRAWSSLTISFVESSSLPPFFSHTVFLAWKCCFFRLTYVLCFFTPQVVPFWGFLRPPVRFFLRRNAIFFSNFFPFGFSPSWNRVEIPAFFPPLP